jgi:hypothetical protein
MQLENKKTFFRKILDKVQEGSTIGISNTNQYIRKETMSKNDFVVIESGEYRKAQERLLQDPVFIGMMMEVGTKALATALETEGRFTLNLRIRDEYHRRSGPVNVYGLGDYVKAMEIWVERMSDSE